MSALLTMPEVRMSDEPSTSTVRVDNEIVRMARIICAHTQIGGGKQMKLVDYLDGILRGPITARYNEIIASLATNPKPVGKRKGSPE